MPAPPSPHDPIDHLLLLIGGNPLPNAVAAAALLKPGGTVVPIYTPDVLLQTEGIPGTEQIKIRLERMLPEHFVRHRGIPINPTDAHDIYAKVKAYLTGEAAGKDVRVGLHYTGGTKAMAVHAHRALRDFDSNAQLSYLDSRSLRLYFDTDPSSPEARPFRYVGLQPEVSFSELINLHGWRYKDDVEPMSEQLPALLQLCQAFLDMNEDEKALKAYNEWKYNKATGWRDNWNSKRYYKLKNIPFPAGAAALGTAMRTAFSLPPHASSFDMETAARTLGFEGSRDQVCKDLGRWLDGSWLESLVLDVLQQLKEKLVLHDAYMSVNLAQTTSMDTHFEFDVVAMRGYQLFAFSCTADRRPADQKRKLFELYMRAQQFGGDEACMALVGTSDDHKAIAAEAKRDIGASRIAVFGREHLRTLKDEIGDWIIKQTGRP